MHVDTEDDVPKHKKRAEKSKPWILERRVHPEFRKGQGLVFLDRDWHTSSRYKTEERAEQAKGAADKSQNHGLHVCSIFFEYRVRKA